MVQVWKEQIIHKKKVQRTSIGLMTIFAGTAAIAVLRKKKERKRKE
ncbi:hypothetical protein SAMN05444487_104164 [Marininema mesophilum]|uniref:Uncharacterized protein n=1 Tax=Marininema mesophilum TaxID=1048340 RepID=A0A1H2UNL1_9BACL|nr:hypothetical protein [Marininema mesophilum]SDW57692.1 hypothetical protein SAMN05444487_104164 [Marininema mesophilum]